MAFLGKKNHYLSYLHLLQKVAVKSGNNVNQIKTIVLLWLLLLATGNLWAQTTYYCNPAVASPSTINSSVWSTTLGGPYTSTVPASPPGGAILVFQGGTIAGATHANIVEMRFDAPTAWTAGGTITNSAGTPNINLNVPTGITQTFPQIFSGTTTITKIGGGTIIMNTNSQTYTSTTITQGTISISQNNGVAGTVTLDGGTLQVTATINPFTRPITTTTIGGVIEVTGAVTVTASGAFSGASNITKTGTGTLVYSGTNTLTGGTIVINEGTFSTSTITSLVNTAPNWIMNGGTYTYSSGTSVSTTKYFVVPNGTTSAINIATAATNLTVSGASPITTGSLNKVGPGTLTLSGANAYTGTTTITAGILALGAAGVIADASNINFNGGTLNTANFSETVGNLSVSAASNLTMGASNTLTFSGAGSINSTLAITGYTNGSSHIFVGNSSLLSVTDLSKITINGAATCQLNTGELVPAATISISGGATMVNYPTVSSVTFTQTGAAAGGTWSVSPTTLGSIDASTGVFTAIGFGNVIVAYTTADGCASTKTFTIGSDAFSTNAPNILFNPLDQCLTGATRELANCQAGTNQTNAGAATFTNNFMFHCAFNNAGCTGTASNQANKTDFNDLWYKVTLPIGTTQMTLNVTGISGSDHIAFGLYTAQPTTSNSHNAVTTASISGSTTTMGGAFFNSTQTSHLITNLTAGGTYYIRVMGAFSSTSTSSVCSSIPHPCFTIEAQAPQANDVCTNAINITTNNGGAADTKNYSNATSEASDEWNSCPVVAGQVTAAKDLWYRVNYPSTTATYFTELSLTGTAGQQVRIITYNVTSACNGSGGIPTATEVDRCDVVTLTGSTQTFTIQNASGSSNLTSVQNQSRFIQVIPIGTVGNVTISATVVSANNDCSWFDQPFPGFDIDAGAVSADFNYSTPSSSYPTQTGNDLWFQFDPISGNDGFGIVYSTTADVTITGLTSGQNLTVYLYKRHGSSGNCVDLAGDYLSTTNVTTNGTFKILCLDEQHGTSGVGDGYLIRVVQTAGTTATPTIQVTPGAVGPSNNSYQTICSGTGPAIGPAGNPNSDAAHNWNQFWIKNGETRSGTFVGANDCGLSGVCNAVNYEAIQEVNDRDVWYVFQTPANLCNTLGLTQSTVVEQMNITYNAGSAVRDGVLYVYDACNTTTPIACSGSLDGAGTTWTATGLEQGKYYLLRVKPWDISSTPTDWTFNITVNNGTARPCNDDPADAVSLSLPNCPTSSSVTSTSYTALSTYSAQAASPETVGSSDNTVWFKFTAPSPANGGDYSGLLERSWVTVFLEGQSNHLIEMELYEAGGTTKANGQQATYSVNGIGDRTWGWFGSLDPGAEYMIRLKHNQLSTINVQYKIDIWAGGMQNGFDPLSCGNNSSLEGTAARLCGSCGDITYDNKQTTATATQSLCEEWYKIDLPWVTSASTKYWVIEVRGFKQMLDFELRKQVITETINPGGQDYDHPCWSREIPDSPGAADEQIMSNQQKGYDYDANQGPPYFLVDGNYLESGSCNDLTGNSPHSGGYRKVYRGLVGATDIPYTKNYYYIRVFMNPNDPQFNDCEQNGGINVCKVIFKGPYTTAALAQAGNSPDGGACGIIANTTDAANDFTHTLLNTPVSGNLALNDYDLEGNTQTYTTTPVTNPANGTVSISTNGSYTYTPNNGFTGQDSFVYQVCDNGTPQACDNATVFIEVIPNLTTANEPPIANPDHYVTEINTTVSGSIISNDHDPDNNTISINTTPITNPTNGTVTINTNGTYTYTPNTGFIGTDSFVYEICDNGTPPLCDQTIVTIDIIPNNDNITFAGDDSGIGYINTPIIGNVLSNDFDAEGNTITLNLTPITNPTNGTVTLNPDGSYTYIPNNNFVGNDIFTYQICDNGSPQACDIAAVHISILSAYAIGGTLFQDPDGLTDNSVDGTGLGTASATQLYANLVQSGSVAQSVALPATGIYSFSGLSAGSYTVVIATSATATTPSVPAGWVNVGEAFGSNNGTGSGNESGTPNGSIAVTVGSADVIGVDFGIEQPPTAGTATSVTQSNPGGATNVQVDNLLTSGNAPIFSASDPDGTISSITITTFPTNVTSITINGSLYTSGTFPSGGVSVPTNGSGVPTQIISVDPVDGNVNVGISYTTTDAAGIVSNTGTATVPFGVTYAIGGTLFQDPDGLTDNSVDGTGLGTASATQLYANLISGSSVAQSVALPATGIYSFSGLSAGSYTVVIATSATATTPSVPAGWVNVGEAFGSNNGAGSGNESGTPNGSIAVTVGSADVIGVNFGIEQPPTAGTATSVTQSNPGGTTSVQVDNLLTSGNAPIFSASDPDGTISSITITTFPTNVTSITINGNLYTSGTFPGGGVSVPTNGSGVPTQIISVDPVDGNVNVVISYTTTDAAGIVSNTGTATVPFVANINCIANPGQWLD
ncbi:MAG: tandem-95 repeat protein [Chitinophagales bacterium]|nr:tandem-95 repeat protein [Chitinophagales bacterium]